MRAWFLLAVGLVIGVGGFGAPGEVRAATQKLTYVYDDLGRMTRAIYDSAWVIEYTWDDNGNLLQREVKAFTVDVPSGENSALRFWLGPALPNPFGGGTVIRFALARPVPTRLDVYDVAGRRVNTLVDGKLEPGDHTIEWDGRDGAGRVLPSNVYFYVLNAGEFTAKRRVVLVR